MKTDRDRRVVRAENEQLLLGGLDLVGRVLGKDPKEERRLLELDPGFDPRDTFLVVLDGTVISHLRLVRREMRIGRSLLRLAVVADVVTDPAHQGRGNTRTVIDLALEAARAARYHCAVLFTELPDLFSEQGWSSWAQPGCSIILKALVIPAAEQQVRHFRPDDLGAVMALHGHYGSAFAGPLARTIGWWKADLQRETPPGEVLVLEVDGRIAGYAQARARRRRPEEFAILDLAALNDNGQRLLLRELVRRAHQRGFTSVNLQGPIAGRLAAVAPELGRVAELRRDKHTMFKLVNLRRLVGALIPEFEAICGRDGLCEDGQIDLLVGHLAAELSSSAGKFEVSVPRSNKPSFLQLSEGDFWRMLFDGRMPPTAPEPAMLRTLFPEREFAFWPADEP